MQELYPLEMRELQQATLYPSRCVIEDVSMPLTIALRDVDLDCVPTEGIGGAVVAITGGVGTVLAKTAQVAAKVAVKATIATDKGTVKVAAKVAKSAVKTAKSTAKVAVKTTEKTLQKVKGAAKRGKHKDERDRGDDSDNSDKSDCHDKNHSSDSD